MAPSPDAVQSRRAQASCDLCKRMKIRCEKHGDKCSHCVARGITCKFTLAPKKHRVKKADHFNSIESRIKRMESLLQSSGVVVSSVPSSLETSCSKTIEEQTTPAPIDDLSNLVISDAGAQKYIGDTGVALLEYFALSNFPVGASSGFALLSPRGLSWVQEKTGSNRLSGVLHRMRSEAQMWPQFSTTQWWPLPDFTGHPLPSREVVRQIATHYFKSFNATFPLFDRKTFSTFLDWHYSSDPPPSKSWYGALNIVLSIGCLTATASMRSVTIIGGPSSRESFMDLSLRFFQNASSILTHLLISNNDLMGIQTLVGMAFVMQAVLNPEASFILIAAAARMGHSLGLHRWLDGFGLSQSELEQRRRVFWIIYILEKSTCLRIGRPSTINDDDIGVPLPPEDLHDEGNLGIPFASIPGRVFYPFQAACAIALIESKVYSQLYSVRSWTIMPGERLNRVSRLDQELQEWKDNIPLEIRPEHTIQCESEHKFAIIMLHFGYYNCLTTIHRVSIHHRSWISKDGDAGSDATPPKPSPSSSTSGPLNPRVYASYALCLSAARSTIHIATHLLGSGDDPRNCLIWLAIYFPLTACLTLFAHTLQAPLDPRVENDLELMERSLKHLNLPANIGPKPSSSLVVDIFGDVITIAREYVKKMTAGDSSGAPTSRNAKDSVLPAEPIYPPQAPHASIHSPQSPPPASPFPSSLHPPTSAPQFFQLSADPTAGPSPSEFSSNQPFHFLPFDMTEPDPTFMFALDWSQWDFTGAMDSGAEFLVTD